MGGFRLTDEQKGRMVDLYRGGVSADQAAATVGATGPSCLRALHSAGFKSRLRSESLRQYKVNHEFFDRIDSSDSAYWLGFISGDGCIDRAYNRVVIGLRGSDVGHLKLFRSVVDSDYPIRHRNVKGYLPSGKYYVGSLCSFCICSSHMVSALRRLGVTERKSHTIRPCKDIPSEYQRDYWRGLVDADGTISPRSNRRLWEVGLSGSEYIIKGFHTFVSGQLSSRVRPRDNKRGCWIIGFGGMQLPAAVVKLLGYQDEGAALQRKKHLALQLIDQAARSTRRDWSFLTVDLLCQLRKEHGSWRAVAESLGTYRQNLYAVRRRLGIGAETIT